MASDYKNQNEGRYTTLHDYTNLSFAERMYFRFSPSTIVLRRLLNILDRYQRIAKKKHYKILDIGCGGGIKDLVYRGDVYGIDISESSLKNAKKIYRQVRVVDLSKQFPFPDNTFDIVFCSEVYGHIASKDKENFLKEAKRVLQKDGFFLFSCETNGDNWLTRSLQRQNLYQKLWVEYDGHIGLEPPEKVLLRFKKYFPDIHYTINNTYIFTIDELLTVYPMLVRVFGSNSLRRGANILLAPLYNLSLHVTKLSAANNICVYGKK